MKRFLTLALVAIVALGCSKDDGVGAYAISGAPEITSLAAGYKRVVVTWEHNTSSDESNYSNVYWNDGDSSSGLAITSLSASTITVEVTNLSEGEHTFYVQNVNTLKNQQSAESTPITIYVYGDSFVKDLAQRTISSIDYLSGDDIEDGAYVTWSSFNNTDGAIGNMLYYRNQSNVDAEFFCSIDDEKTLVPDAIVETELDYATLYCPEGCLDTLATSSIAGGEFPMSNDGIIRVASIVAMQPYFSQDNVHVILEKGDYSITPADYAAGDFPALAPNIQRIMDDSGNKTGDAYITMDIPSFFLLSGNNSIYDFGGSTVTTLTTTYQLLGGNCDPIRFTGNENILRNLIYVDEGVSESTQTSITNVIIDGRDNILEYFELHSTGSYPYGYGELFGKGGGNVISHQKHCGILVRGNFNTLQDSKVYHKAYGHCVFMQGAEDPTIQRCYIQSEVSTTEAVYAEKGSGSPADNADFLTYFGFHMTENYHYTMALCEEGIRAYDSGVTVIDGEPYDRGSVQRPRILYCEVKDARGGVTLTHSSSAYVEGCKAVGCGRGFAIPNNSTIIDCEGDAHYGPAYGVDYQSNSGTSVDMTIIDSEGAEWITVDDARAGWINTGQTEFETCNGTAHIVYIEGTNHTLKFRDGRVNDKGTQLKITKTGCSYTDGRYSFAHFGLGGDDRNLGSIWMSDIVTDELDENGDPTGEQSQANSPETLSDDDSYLTNSSFANETDWPVWIDSRVSGCTIYSNGVVYIEDGATGNTIYLGEGVELADLSGGSARTNNTVIDDVVWDIDTCF